MIVSSAAALVLFEFTGSPSSFLKHHSFFTIRHVSLGYLIIFSPLPLKNHSDSQKCVKKTLKVIISLEFAAPQLFNLNGGAAVIALTLRTEFREQDNVLIVSIC